MSPARLCASGLAYCLERTRAISTAWLLIPEFKSKLESVELVILKADGISIKASYSNLLTWRNSFAHVGMIPSTATYDEVKKSYLYGRRLIDCLADTMKR